MALQYLFIQFSSVICFPGDSRPRITASELSTAVHLLQAAGAPLSRLEGPGLPCAAGRGPWARRCPLAAPAPGIPQERLRCLYATASRTLLSG